MFWPCPSLQVWVHTALLHPPGGRNGPPAGRHRGLGGLGCTTWGTWGGRRGAGFRSDTPGQGGHHTGPCPPNTGPARPQKSPFRVRRRRCGALEILHSPRPSLASASQLVLSAGATLHGSLTPEVPVSGPSPAPGTCGRSCAAPLPRCPSCCAPAGSGSSPSAPPPRSPSSGPGAPAGLSLGKRGGRGLDTARWALGRELGQLSRVPPGCHPQALPMPPHQCSRARGPLVQPVPTAPPAHQPPHPGVPASALPPSGRPS